MELCEKETTILMNDADIRDGFFHFGTSKRNHYERIKKTFPEYIIEESTERIDNTAVYWNLKLDACLLTKKGFAIRKPRVISDELRLKLQARARKSFGYKS